MYFTARRIPPKWIYAVLRMPSTSKSIRQQPDGRFLVRYRYGRKERRKLFESQSEASDFVRAENQKIRAFGQTGIELTGSQFGRVFRLIEGLAEDGDPGRPRISIGVLALEDAVDFWLKHRHTIVAKRASAVLVGDAVERMIVQWERENKNRGYIATARGLLRRFARDYPKATLAQLTPIVLKNWILQQPPGIRVSCKARLSALFAFGIMNTWVERNPCTLFTLPRTKKQAVVVPVAAEIERFMRTTEEDEWKTLAPYFALRFFCGVRREEAIKLCWQHLDVEKRKLMVPVGIAAKNGPAREVPLSDNAIAWLTAYRRGESVERIAPDDNLKLEAAFRKTGFRDAIWHNALRHAYGSYRYPLIENLEKLATEMGNSKRVLLSHYLGSVASDDVPRFWAIMPQGRVG